MNKADCPLARPRTGQIECMACKELKPANSFGCRGARKGHSRFTRCRPCRTLQAREYRYLKRFGLTWEEYQAMLVKQNYRCLACGRLADRGRGPWSTRPSLVLDHDHETGKHRALVCNRCNWAIGILEDTKLVKRLKKYLALFGKHL